jgi:large subunit ribosomal protein L28
MSSKCDICGKQISSGFSVSKSKIHTKRTWIPNIKRVRVLENGHRVYKNVCTRCLRTGLVAR